MRSWGRAAIAVICLLGATGCWLPGISALERSEAGDRVDGEERRRVEAALTRLRAAREQRRSLRAYARARIQAVQGKARVREIIAAERPGRLRVETLNFLGQAQSLLVADGDEAALYDGGQVIRSAYPGELLARLGLDLGPEEALDLLLATPRIPSRPPRAIYAAGEDRVAAFDRYRVRLGPSGDIVGVENLDGEGALRWIVEFERWSEVSGGRYPLEIRAYFPGTDLRAEFTFEEVELNQPLDAALFRMRDPRE